MKKVGFGLLLASSMMSTIATAQEAITHNGLDADFYAADGDTAVLLLHGTLAHNRMEIIATIAGLVADDYGLPVLAPNLSYQQPGREGMLDCGITHTHKDSDAVEEIAQWVEYLEAQGYQKIVVSAHSRGGAQMSAYLAERASANIGGAVLIAPAVYNAEYAATSYQSRFGVPLSEIMAEAQSLAPDTVMDVPGFVYCENAKATAAAVLDYYTPRANRDTPTNLTKISMPVAVIAGSEDDVVAGLPKALETTPGIGDNVSLEVLEGADHFFRDLYADDVAATIADMAESQ